MILHGCNVNRTQGWNLGHGPFSICFSPCAEDYRREKGTYEKPAGFSNMAFLFPARASLAVNALFIGSVVALAPEFWSPRKTSNGQPHLCGVIFNLLCYFLFMHEFIGQKGGVYNTSSGPFRKGAFGRIYRAHLAIDTPFLPTKSDVILKFAKRAVPGETAQSTIVHSFGIERSVLERVSHPNIVRLYDHGEHLGLPFLVEERCPGRPLVHRLRHAIQWKSMALGLLDALGALHESGIAHGDLNGRNFIFDGRTFKLIDFGSSIMLDTRMNPSSWRVDMDIAVEILMRQLPDVRCSEAARNALLDALRDGGGLSAKDLKEAILQTGSLPS
jgi:hypothetical protein